MERGTIFKLISDRPALIAFKWSILLSILATGEMVNTSVSHLT